MPRTVKIARKLDALYQELVSVILKAVASPRRSWSTSEREPFTAHGEA